MYKTSSLNSYTAFTHVYFAVPDTDTQWSHERTAHTHTLSRKHTLPLIQFRFSHSHARTRCLSRFAFSCAHMQSHKNAVAPLTHTGSLRYILSHGENSQFLSFLKHTACDSPQSVENLHTCTQSYGHVVYSLTHSRTVRHTHTVSHTQIAQVHTKSHKPAASSLTKNCPIELTSLTLSHNLHTQLLAHTNSVTHTNAITHTHTHTLLLTYCILSHTLDHSYTYGLTVTVTHTDAQNLNLSYTLALN